MTSWATVMGQLPGSYFSKVSPRQVAHNIVGAEVEIAQAKTMQIDMPLVVQGRDVMKELDEMRDALLLIKRDVDMEAKYPRLKEIKDKIRHRQDPLLKNDYQFFYQDLYQ